MNVPNEQTLYSEPDENQQQIDKQVGLVIQNCDGFVGSADLFQPVEIGHCFDGQRSDVVAWRGWFTSWLAAREGWGCRFW
ncbi:hypothetical protein EsDP_00004969 [Epichloe bromicola]|uniref:Uncharacterized protein n=1 Tax=Epichloe bromicola TaxID=79588 RepID=A0ABQ0CTF0_9HYPO